MINFTLKITLSISLVFIFQTSTTAQIFLNEIMASNETSFLDGQGNTPDWIELYNASDTAINLKDWQLSDEATAPEKWVFPEITIPANGFLMLFASGNEAFDGTYWHTNFKLSKAGESLVLTKADGELVDFIEFGAQETDQSFGRKTDGSSTFSIFLDSTPNRSNDTGNISSTTEIMLAFSHEPGFYTEGIELKVTTELPDFKMHFTLDGSIPDENDAIIEDFLKLNSNNQPAATIANISTGKDWKSPANEVETHHNIRVRAFKNGVASNQVLSGTFIIANTDHFPYSLPVVSISTDAENLFSEDKGIYVEGNADNYNQSGRDWERPAHFAYFSKDGALEIEQNIGIRIGGATTRAAAQKTLKLYARSEYGTSRFDFPFFGENYDASFKRLAIRTTMGDKTKRGFTDDFCQQLIENEVTCDGIQRRFVIVLLNGEYWGIHSLREVVGEHFMGRKAEIDKDEIDYLFNEGQVKHGNNAEYLELIDYLENHSLVEAEHFDYVANRVDIEKFIDYNIVQFALANDDWPNNNVKFWKTKDGKWRWVINDLDDTMRESNQSRWRLYFEAHRAHHTKWEDLEWAFLLLGKLLENKVFREDFTSHFNYFMNTTMSPANTLPLLEEMVEELRPEMKKHMNRWHFPKNENQWEKGIEEARIFLLRRPSFVLNEIFEWLGSSYKWSPNPAHDFIQLKVPENEGQIAKLTIFNNLGQLIFQKNIQLNGVAEELPVDLPFSREAGLYYFKLDIGRQVLTEKIMLF